MATHYKGLKMKKIIIKKKEERNKYYLEQISNYEIKRHKFVCNKIYL